MAELEASGDPAAGGVETARGLAIKALVEVDRSGGANTLVPGLLRHSRLPTRDRGFTTELVYGTVRMRRACDWLIDRRVHRSLDSPVRAALRLGAYQMAFLDTPPHAAVSATVAEVMGPARGFVNAVLRRIATDVEGGVVWPDEGTRLSYPDWLIDRLRTDLGAEAALGALEQMNQPAAASHRPDGYVQDEASQEVAAALGVQPGERVADVCAAPGGKATYMAYGPAGPTPAYHAHQGGPSLVIALDVDPSRAAMVASNAGRLAMTNLATIAADGCAPPFRSGTFDRVLIDAPCSGLGVLRRRPDARWRIRPGDVPRLAALQRRLLDAGSQLVKPGGLLLYSVCTFTLAETAAIDRWLASACPGARPVRPALPPHWERVGRGARVLPQAAGTDGMFLLMLRVDSPMPRQTGTDRGKHGDRSAAR
jgi:16S rRNA (cytosine967-C5)-methyltransferase